MSIEAIDIHKRFGAFVALSGVSLRVETGQLTAILGPSGSGKTTLLRVLAGLERPDRGRVRLFDEDATERHVRERGIGFVFQHYALFKHMTVRDNVAFGLTVRARRARPSKAQIRGKVDELLALVQLDSHADRLPTQLSGGQRQRVALARALALEPRVLLLDEPFGALDAKVRAELRRWLRRLHDRMHVTSVFVTHDQEEALEVADTVAVLNHGRLEQVGTPAEVYHSPATPFVCSFLGRVNIFSGRYAGAEAPQGGAGEHATHAGAAFNGSPRFAGNGAGPTVYARPHEMDLFPLAAGPVEGGVRATVTHVNPAGSFVRVELDAPEHGHILVDLSHDRFRELGVVRGDAVLTAPRGLRVFEQGAGI